MKWGKTLPRLGEERTVVRFLWWPVRTTEYWLWLERVRRTEVFRRVATPFGYDERWVLASVERDR